jgi:hypothetical protein
MTEKISFQTISIWAEKAEIDQEFEFVEKVTKTFTQTFVHCTER